MGTYQVARNWDRDGWREKDWEDLTRDAQQLCNIALDFDSAVGSGGGGLKPSEVAELSKRAQAVAERMKQISGGYL